MGITMYDDEYKYCIKKVLKKIKLSYNKIPSNKYPVYLQGQLNMFSKNEENILSSSALLALHVDIGGLL